MHESTLVTVEIVLNSGETLLPQCLVRDYWLFVRRHEKFVQGLAARTDNYSLATLGSHRICMAQIAAFSASSVDGEVAPLK